MTSFGIFRGRRRPLEARRPWKTIIRLDGAGSGVLCRAPATVAYDDGPHGEETGRMPFSMSSRTTAPHNRERYVST